MSRPNLGVGIIGCGLIGGKRASHLKKGQLQAVFDVKGEAGEALAHKHEGCRVAASAQDLVQMPEVDVVVVATLNSTLAPLAKMALECGKHVLVEKPGAISYSQMDELGELSKRNGLQLRVGFNHRYHPAFQKAYEIMRSGSLGSIMMIRGRYGHGGRLGYDQEWRADPKRSGGGELMDQGVHLIDLASSFLGEFKSIEGHALTTFWKMPVDDNAFMNLRTAQNQTAWLQVSCTEWKNLFSFEIYGKNAKLQIEGLGGSYGVERLSHYQMLPEMGPPETTIYEYPMADQSWKLEMEEFFEDILLDRTPRPGAREAKHVLEVVETIYRKSQGIKFLA